MALSDQEKYDKLRDASQKKLAMVHAAREQNDPDPSVLRVTIAALSKQVVRRLTRFFLLSR